MGIQNQAQQQEWKCEARYLTRPDTKNKTVRQRLHMN
jgi:hypothetical protein